MTLQSPEEVEFEGRALAVANNGWDELLSQLPLEPYLQAEGRPALVSPSTNCARGYLGDWAIEEGRLRLVAFQGWIQPDEEGPLEEVGLAFLFPEARGPVEATWFNGPLVLSDDRAKKHLFFEVESGRVGLVQRKCWESFPLGPWLPRLWIDWALQALGYALLILAAFAIYQLS